MTRHLTGGGTGRLTRRALLGGLAGAALMAAVQPLRSQTEDERFRVLDFDWADAARQRPVPVRLYLPLSAGPAQSAPLVVFSHGIGGSRAGYRYLGSHWAAQGIASLHLQHVGSDRSLWTGNPLQLVFRLQAAAQESEALNRVQDLRFALDRLLGSETGSSIDGTRIVAAGHSYGANTTLLAVGAAVEREGRLIDVRDERVRAAIVISAPPFYGEGDPARVLSRVTVPTLHVTATEDVIRIPGYYSGADDRVAVFDGVAGRDKTLAVFAGGSHSMFTDRAGTGGTLLNPQVKAATRALSLAFLQRVFDGDDTAMRAWPQQHAALLARYVGPPARAAALTMP